MLASRTLVFPNAERDHKSLNGRARQVRDTPPHAPKNTIFG